MGFTAALDASRTVKGPQCSIAKVLAEMQPADVEEFGDAMLDNQIAHVSIERALIKMRDDKEIQTKVGKGAVGRHRKLECSCFEGS